MNIFDCFGAEDLKFLRRKVKVRLSENKNTKIKIMIDVLNMTSSSKRLRKLDSQSNNVSSILAEATINSLYERIQFIFGIMP